MSRSHHHKGAENEAVARMTKLRTALERTYQRPTEQTAQPCLKTTIDGWPVTLLKDKTQTHFTFEFDGSAREQAQFLAAYGSQDPDFVFGLIAQLANLGAQSESPDVVGFKFALSAVRGMAPRDVLEGMTCTQSAAFHLSSMMFADRSAEAPGYTDMESAEQSSSRLSRTYSALSYALDRHRSGHQMIARRRVIADGAQTNGNALWNGAQDPDFVAGLLGPLSNLGTRSGLPVNEDLIKFVRAVVKGMAPRDTREAMTSAQIGVFHVSTMMFANCLTHAEDFAEMNSAERSLNKHSRTFCALMEAFDRQWGHRELAVRQVSSGKSAQAVVGDFSQHGTKMPGESNGHASA